MCTVNDSVCERSTGPRLLSTGTRVASRESDFNAHDVSRTETNSGYSDVTMTGTMRRDTNAPNSVSSRTTSIDRRYRLTGSGVEDIGIKNNSCWMAANRHFNVFKRRRERNDTIVTISDFPHCVWHGLPLYQ